MDQAQIDSHAFMETYSGKRFHIFDPNVGDAEIEDIAHSLSLVCRYGGHIKEFWSVGQHSVYVSQMMERDAPEGQKDRWSLIGLIHDFHEAYIGDMIYPVKDTLRRIPEVRDILDKMTIVVDDCIFNTFRIPRLNGEERIILKYYDKKALVTEGYYLFKDRGRSWIHLYTDFLNSVKESEPLIPEVTARWDASNLTLFNSILDLDFGHVENIIKNKFEELKAKWNNW